MTEELMAFGGKFKHERELRGFSLMHVAQVTKIPSRTLERLEAGKFDELPAEVFVRGFVGSYARVLGMNAEEAVREYGALMATTAEAPKSDLKGAHDVKAEPEGPAPITFEIGFIAKSLSDASRRSYRGSLALAVLILVIVATITISVLLKNPNHIGDGISLGEVLSAQLG